MFKVESIVFLWIDIKLVICVRTNQRNMFFFSVRCRRVICVVTSGRWTAPSGVGRWLFHGEGMAAGHGLWFVLPVRKGKWLTFQCQSFFMCFAVCSGLFLAGISWYVRGAIVREWCLVGDYGLHFCAWSQLASCFWWADRESVRSTTFFGLVSSWVTVSVAVRGACANAL